MLSAERTRLAISFTSTGKRRTDCPPAASRARTSRTELAFCAILRQQNLLVVVGRRRIQKRREPRSWLGTPSIRIGSTATSKSGLQRTRMVSPSGEGRIARNREMRAETGVVAIRKRCSRKRGAGELVWSERPGISPCRNGIFGWPSSIRHVPIASDLFYGRRRTIFVRSREAESTRSRISCLPVQSVTAGSRTIWYSGGLSAGSACAAP